MESTHNRRSFLKKISLSAAGVIASSELLKSAALNLGSSFIPRFPSIGIQLYTVRDSMDKDIIGTLKKVSDIGYKQLELAGYNEGKFYGYSPEEFGKIVRDLGLDIISSHTGVEVSGINLDNAKAMTEAHARLGVKYCVQPWVVEERRKTIDSYKKLVQLFNSVGEIMKPYNIMFGYHNHNFEFNTVEGQIPFYDVFMKEADMNLLTFEIDIYWAVKAGQDPVKIFNDYPGRFQLWHIKDMEASADQFFAPVGSGTIDFKKIFNAKEISGMKYFFVEQDDTRDNNPFDCIKTSYENLITKIL